MSSPSARHLPAWFGERFPPSHGVLFLVMYVTALLYGRLLVTDGALAVGPGDAVGFAAAWCFFLMLRVFDEHKDFELDLQNHPERVLQSGRVTLGHLKVLGAVAVATQLGVSVWIDGGVGPVTLCWAVVMGWSALMGKEFFVGEWLEQRLVLYAVSHMVVMPAALVWMATMGGGGAWLPAAVGLLAALSLLSGAAFEVTRKAKGAEEERASIRTYSQVWGPRLAAGIVFFLLVGQVAIEILLLFQVFPDGVHPGWLVGLGASIALPTATLWRYAGEPTASARKLNEGMVSLAMLAAYGVLLAAMIVQRGLQWS